MDTQLDTQLTYNGWKNYETWNIALWIGNDESIYLIAKASEDYAEFMENIGQLSFLPIEPHGVPISLASVTPDGVAWDDDSLDISALNELIEEL